MREASLGNISALIVEEVFSVDRRGAIRRIRVQGLHQLVGQPADLARERGQGQSALKKNIWGAS